MPSTAPSVRAVTSPTRRPVNGPGPDADGDRRQVAPVDARLGEHGDDRRCQQLAVPPGVDRGALGEHAVAVGDRDGDRGRRGVESEQHGRRA